MTLEYELNWKRVPVMNVSGKPSQMKTFELAASTNQAAVQGSTTFSSVYELYPIAWSKALVDAAKARQIFVGLLNEISLPAPNQTYVVSKRKYYLPSGSWSHDTGEIATAGEINWTAINTPDGVQIAPTQYTFGAEVTNLAIRTNVLDVVKYAREEILYHDLDYTDTLAQAVFTGASTQSADSAATSGFKMQTIFGGISGPGVASGSAATSTLAAGDILTPDIIARGRRLLLSDAAYWYSNCSTNTHTKSTNAKKNPWLPEPAEPFVLAIAPEQEESIITNSQFTNAAEYGGNEVIMNGEISRYLGVKIINSVKTPAIAAAGTFTLETVVDTVAVAAHKCYMAKSKKCGTAVWGQKPRLTIFDWPNGMKKKIAMEFAFGVGTVHDDAIVQMILADQ